MHSGTIILLDVSFRMFQRISITDFSGFEGTHTKLDVAIKGIEQLCMFLQLHHPWEKVSLYVFSNTYRQIIEPCAPDECRQKLRKNPDLSWLRNSSSKKVAVIPAYYPSMLGAAHQATLNTGESSTVIVFCDGALNAESAKMLDFYPRNYWSSNFVPLPNSSFLFFVRFVPTEKTANVPFPTMLKNNYSRGGIFSFVTSKTLDIKNAVDHVCLKLFAPWQGKFIFSWNSIDMEENYSIFPNPWGMRGIQHGHKTPTVINLNEVRGSMGYRPRIPMVGKFLVLPNSLLPALWKITNQKKHLEWVSKVENAQIWQPFADFDEDHHRKSLHHKLITEILHPSAAQVVLCMGNGQQLVLESASNVSQEFKIPESCKLWKGVGCFNFILRCEEREVSAATSPTKQVSIPGKRKLSVTDAENDKTDISSDHQNVAQRIEPQFIQKKQVATTWTQNLAPSYSELSDHLIASLPYPSAVPPRMIVAPPFAPSGLRVPFVSSDPYHGYDSYPPIPYPSPVIFPGGTFLPLTRPPMMRMTRPHFYPPY